MGGPASIRYQRILKKTPAVIQCYFYSLKLKIKLKNKSWETEILQTAKEITTEIIPIPFLCHWQRTLCHKLVSHPQKFKGGAFEKFDPLFPKIGRKFLTRLLLLEMLHPCKP